MSNFGINNTTKTTGMKRFVLNPEENKGLSLGEIVDVKVDTFTQKETSKLETLRGLECPRLSFVFEQANNTGGTHIESFNPIEYC